MPLPLADIGYSRAAGFVARLFGGQVCECRCGDQTSSEALAIIREQLARCGPEHLAGEYPVGYLVLSHVLAFFLGVSVACLVLAGLSVRRRVATHSIAEERSATPSSSSLEPRKRIGGKGVIVSD